MDKVNSIKLSLSESLRTVALQESAAKKISSFLDHLLQNPDMEINGSASF
jgi:hypothetical protein